MHFVFECTTWKVSQDPHRDLNPKYRSERKVCCRYTIGIAPSQQTKCTRIVEMKVTFLKPE